MFDVLANKSISISNIIVPYILGAPGGDAGHEAGTAVALKLARTLFAFFDRTIIWLINSSYQLIMDIADAQIFSETILQLFGNRIYILIAIFMLFKMAITLIRYLADPDSATDQTTGMGNIAKKAVFALGLLVLVPFIFQEAYNFQSFVINNQTIGRIILGVPQQPTDENAMILSFGVYTPFIYPNRDIVGDACDNVYYISGGLPDECRDAIMAVGSPDDENLTMVVDVFDNAIRMQSAEFLASNLIIGSTVGQNNFVFTYQPIISGIIGFIVALILISFCFDIAIRAVKLGFLQLIAPIPILSSLDPKNEMLNKWALTCVGTYLDLFIRLIAIFFSIFVVSIVKMNTHGLTRYSDGSAIESTWVVLFVIVGALLFAKQLPNLIADILGTKFEGGFTLNPLDRLRQAPLAGKAFGIATGVAGGVWGGAIAGRDSGTSVRGAVHGAITGGLAGNRGISTTGEAEGQKEHFGIYQGMQAAYKDYTGNEMAVLSSEKIVQTIPGLKQLDKKVIDKRLDQVKQPLKKLAAIEQQLKLDLTVETGKLQEMSKEIGQAMQKRNNEIQALNEQYQRGDISASDFQQKKQQKTTEFENLEANLKRGMSDQREAIIKRQKVLKSINDDIEVWKDQLKDIRTAGKVDVSRKEKMKEVNENLEKKWNKSSDEIIRDL